MKTEDIKTLGRLKASGYVSKSIQEEMKDNLLLKLKNKEEMSMSKQK